MSADPKFTVGSFWRTRDGRKARIICVDARGPDHHPIVALVFNDVVEIPRSYLGSGRFWANDEAAPDLIEPWKEPEPAKADHERALEQWFALAARELYSELEIKLSAELSARLNRLQESNLDLANALKLARSALVEICRCRVGLTGDETSTELGMFHIAQDTLEALERLMKCGEE